MRYNIIGSSQTNPLLMIKTFPLFLVICAGILKIVQLYIIYNHGFNNGLRDNKNTIPNPNSFAYLTLFSFLYYTTLFILIVYVYFKYFHLNPRIGFLQNLQYKFGRRPMGMRMGRMNMGRMPMRY